MNRYFTMFKKLKKNKEGCFIPFVALGDPSIQTCYTIIDILVNSGANALELGIPFSDPLADGVIVQNANLRALSNNITMKKCFDMLYHFRQKYYKIPIGILVYANMIYQYGIKNFYQDCKSIDIDSVLIPDIPIEEEKKFKNHYNDKNISSIFICPPNANNILMEYIAKNSNSYIYLISRSGVTGHQNHAKIPDIKIINQLKEYNSVPIIHGFGISKSSHIIDSIRMGSSGVICGSVIIQLIEMFQYDKKNMFLKIKKLATKLKNATIHIQ
ncbi:tryptophan synthase subunit alpha [Buchnera aphidicola]|uniref:tryptophan synthase subunit alpha n=1 Tax=Buchnera aphidicola TaxID=9 RepID=UPI003464D57E